MSQTKEIQKPNLSEVHVESSYGIMYLVKDMLRAKDFYSSLLGQTPSFESETWVEFDLGDQNLCLCRPHNAASLEAEATPQSARAVLKVRDIEDFRKHLSRLRISVSDDIQKVEQGPGRFLNVEDPDGNLIGFYSEDIVKS